MRSFYASHHTGTSHHGHVGRIARRQKAKSSARSATSAGSFFYGRDFIGDSDLDAQREAWLTDVANVRIHQTIKERPIDRFDRDERLVLQPLAPRAYHSLVLSQPKPGGNEIFRTVPPHIVVEKRPLAAYTQLAGGDR